MNEQQKDDAIRAWIDCIEGNQAEIGESDTYYKWYGLCYEWQEIMGAACST